MGWKEGETVKKKRKKWRGKVADDLRKSKIDKSSMESPPLTDPSCCGKKSPATDVFSSLNIDW